MKSFRRLGTIAIIAISLSMACKDDPLSPFQPEVANNLDSFQFQITNAENVSTTVDYDWLNSGAEATVNQSCSITRGSATLTISDSTGVQLYTRNLSDNGTYQSTAGIAGTWKIRVQFSNLYGTVNFRVQKL